MSLPPLWFISAALGLFGAVIIVANWVVLARQIIFKRFESLVPIVGAIFGCTALLMYLSASVRSWWWVPIVVDPSTLMLLAAITT